MTAKTRYFLFGSVLVLVVGLSIGLVAYYGGVPGRLFAAQPGPDELKYVPADAAVVAYANVRAVMGSELRQRLRAFEATSDEGRNEFKNQTGIDIEKDIDHVVAYMGAGAVKDHSSGLVLASGTFDSGRLEALAVEHGGKVEQYKGAKLVTVVPHEGQTTTGTEPAMALAFLADGLMAMGGADIVRQAIDRATGTANVRSNAEVMKLVTDMDDTSMWAVGRFDALRAGTNLPSEVSDRIPPITWFSASGRVNGGVQATVKAETKDEASANNLADIIRGFTALAKMQAGSKPELQKMMPNIDFSVDGKVVSVSFAVTTEMMDAFAAAKTAAGAIKKPKPEEKPEPKAEQK